MDHFLHIQNGAILLNPLKVKRICYDSESCYQPEEDPSSDGETQGNNLDSEYKISLMSVHPSLVAGMEKLPKEVTYVVKQASVGKVAKRSI